jgi:hypothetical protein
MGMRVSHVSKIRCFSRDEKNFFSYKEKGAFFCNEPEPQTTGKRTRALVGEGGQESSHFFFSLGGVRKRLGNFGA